MGNATADLLADYYRCCDSPEECKREETLEKGAGKWIALSEHPKFTRNATQGRTKQVPILASIKHTLEKRFKLNALHTFGEGSSSATSFNATYDFDTYWKTAKKTAGSGNLDTILGILTEAPFRKPFKGINKNKIPTCAFCKISQGNNEKRTITHEMQCLHPKCDPHQYDPTQNKVIKKWDAEWTHSTSPTMMLKRPSLL